MSGAKTKPAGVGEPGHSLENSIQVEQRFAHAHEDHVGERPLVGGQATSGVANLIEDLRGFEVPTETQLARGAERAADRAARLT